MMAEQQTSVLAQKLAAVLQRALQQDVKVLELKALTDGAGAQTWRFTLAHNDQAYIARIAHDGELFAQAINKTQEAAVQQAAFNHQVAVAPVVATFQARDGLGEGYIMPCLEGETRPKKLLLSADFAPARKVLTQQCAQALAAIHSIKHDKNALPVRPTKTYLHDLYAEFQRYAEPLPVFHLAFRYLQQHCPENESLSVVHGDFRTGNLMVNQQGLVAVLDWELAHYGNPLEDLGWFCVNSWRFSKPENPAGGFGSYQELIDAYHQVTGTRVALKSLHYWELFGVLRWGVLCLYQSHVHLRGEERSVERAAIGRRVSECEIDMLELLDTLNTSAPAGF